MTAVSGKAPSPVWVKALDVDVLNNDSAFNAGLQKISRYRKEKTLCYRFRRDRNLSLGAGLLLDTLLQQYGLKEQQMEYGINPFGKPYLKGFPNIHFNLSHAGNYAVCALGATSLGIDIESLRPFDREIAEYCMSSEELSFLDRLSGQEQAKAFTRLWTLKESYLKATGTGLSDGHFPSFQIQENRIIPFYWNYRFYEFAHSGYLLSLCVLQESIIGTPFLPHVEWITQI